MRRPFRKRAAVCSSLKHWNRPFGRFGLVNITDHNRINQHHGFPSWSFSKTGSDPHAFSWHLNRTFSVSFLHAGPRGDRNLSHLATSCPSTRTFKGYHPEKRPTSCAPRTDLVAAELSLCISKSTEERDSIVSAFKPKGEAMQCFTHLWFLV